MSPLTWLRLSVVLVTALVLQVALLDQVVVFGAHPDVMVLLPAAAGLAAGAQRGAVVGFAAGLVADLAVQLPYGISALAFVLVGFGAGLFSAVPLGRDLPGAEVLSCALLGTIAAITYGIVATLVGQPAIFTAGSLVTFLVVAAGALVFAAPVLGALRWCFAEAGPGGAYSMPSGGSALG